MRRLFYCPCDTSPILPLMEETEEHTCGSCTYANHPDEDGLVECRYWPPELFEVNDHIVQLRPRLHPSTKACGLHIPKA